MPFSGLGVPSIRMDMNLLSQSYLVSLSYSFASLLGASKILVFDLFLNHFFLVWLHDLSQWNPSSGVHMPIV